MKYMGSKSRIAKYIVPIIQECIDDNDISTYLEPFCGGCNIIDKIKCNTRIASDKNKYLIALWKHIQNENNLLEIVNRDLYNDVRSNQNTNKYEDWLIGNVGFLASYNGRWFDGGYAQSGYEKTKNGERFRDYYKEAKQNILQQKKLIKDIEFLNEDYTYFKPVNCVIYCDPPYKNTKQYANSKNFNYETFWETMRKWSKNNFVLISEQNAPEDFKCIWKQEVSRSIKANDKSKSVEKLFTYNQGLYFDYINRKD